MYALILYHFLDDELLLSEELQEFYPLLLHCLPMDNTLFFARLSQFDLISSDDRQHIQAKPTRLQKAAYFLDHIIEPGGYCSSNKMLQKLLNVMETEEDLALNKLSKEIKDKIKEDDDVSGMYTICS